MEFPTLLKSELMLLPSNWIAVMATSAISAISKPYSTRDAPSSSDRRERRSENILISSMDTKVRRTPRFPVSLNTAGRARRFRWGPGPAGPGNLLVLDRAGDGIEERVHARAERLDADDRDEGDQGDEETVLHHRGAFIVADHRFEGLKH